jgi:hypothetical protein
VGGNFRSAEKGWNQCAQVKHRRVGNLLPTGSVAGNLRLHARSFSATVEVMSTKSAYALKLPHSVKNAAQRLAAVDGVSLNQFIAVAVAEKIGAIESADFF